MIHADVLGERARLTPNKTAVVDVDSGERLTYRDLDRRAARCARLWRERCGLEKGDRVGILSHNRLEYLDAFFAAGKSGVVLLTLGTRLTAHELEHIVSDAAPRVLLYDGELADTVRELRSKLGAGSPVERWLALDDPLDLAGAPHRGTPERDPVYDAECDELDDAPFERQACAGEDVYCLLYTSGTTGKPKGVMIPHRMVAWNGYNTVCGWQLEESDTSPIFTPLYHAGGLLAFLVPIFTIGGTIVLHREFDAEEIWRTIERERCTVVLGVPTIWKILMDSPAFAEVDLAHVRWCISGGAPLPQYLIAAYQERGVVFKQGFGMTEVGVNCFAMTVEDSFEKAGSIGQPLMFTEVRLVDGEGRDVADGEIGEMLFRGPHTSLGYWRNPEATAAALDADGWFHSGDQARRDEDGFFYVAGRQKDMFISGGVNVYPAEIEGQLVLHPAVEDAAVVGVPDDKWGEVGVAFVVPRAGSELGAGALAAHLGKRLARFKIPKEFHLIDELPRTAYGKVVKGELVERYLAEAVA